MILYELSDLTELLPQTALGLPPAPPPAPLAFRGVAIHWWTYALPTEGPDRRFAPKIPIRVWDWFGVNFTALSRDHTDTPPATTIERDQYLSHAVSIVLAHNIIPEPRTLAWEMRLGLTRFAAVRFHVRVHSHATAVSVHP